MMKKLIVITLSTVLFITSNSVLADLNSDIYISASAAYRNGQWEMAMDLLQKYSASDSTFLEQNPSIKQAIDRAIAYCDKKSKDILIASGIQSVERAPPLPSPPPHAGSTDTGVRL